MDADRLFIKLLFSSHKDEEHEASKTHLIIIIIIHIDVKVPVLHMFINDMF